MKIVHSEKKMKIVHDLKIMKMTLEIQTTDWVYNLRLNEENAHIMNLI